MPFIRELTAQVSKKRGPIRVARLRSVGPLFSPVVGASMQRVNEFEIYELANAVHPLINASDDAKYSEVWLDWYNARTILAKIFQRRSLEVCYHVANELYLAIEKVVPGDWDAALQKLAAIDPDKESTIGWSGAYPIRTAAGKFETILEAELRSSDTYWISPKGTRKTSVLLSEAHVEIPPAILQEIPEVQVDFDEAGRCLLFDTPTAAGFHLLRATEAVIRKYYKLKTGTEPKVKFRNWGAYVKNLREYDPKGAENLKIVRALDHIREDYRNPILHPEDTVDPDDAQVLFGLCVSAIVLMVKEIKALKAKSTALTVLSGTAAAV